MTDDVMSDCVGGDYVIGKMSKNDEIGGAFMRKGMEPRIFRMHPNESLECSLYWV